MHTAYRMISPTPDDDDNSPGDLFREPDGYYEREKLPTFTKHTLPGGETMNLRLVGHNPLWGHHLWFAGQVCADYLQEHSARLCSSNSVLELGAGAGLPGLAAALSGATRVVITDYPDPDLIGNIELNITSVLNTTANVQAIGYLWGTTPLPALLTPRFDVLILADLLFNHSEHRGLLQTVIQCLAQTKKARALVFFTPHRPWLLQKDLAFFELVKENGLIAEKVVEKVMEKAMFEEDPGDELLRRTVWGWEVRWVEVVEEREG